MLKYKIPASITLAQGILESGAGKGRLAVQANNHFGIKCHDWNGKKIYHDDDEEQECFRKYDNPEYSYRDHSLFLSNRGSLLVKVFHGEPHEKLMNYVKSNFQQVRIRKPSASRPNSSELYVLAIGKNYE